MRTQSVGRTQLLHEIARRRLRRLDVAQATGVSAAVVSLWCTGLRRPNRENAAALEVFLGIPPRAWSMGVKPDEEAAA
ncbi:MAG: hypothetical protein CMN30_08365 [Sandaracinus sp.]|nr:hypothetical protein [Sandaracinus sp.]|tara:strand:+ start:2298 stop:2531 length:234 start_codon:yes stop_codon:yes gene_type:complete